MYRFAWVMIAIFGLGLWSTAQRSGQIAATGSATTAQQSGASTATGATNSQDANISHKGKEDDKNAATPGMIQGATSGSSTAQVVADSGHANVASGAAVQAVLNKSIDTKKAKQGDEVTAKTPQDVKVSSALTIPKNSKLIGHVTEVKAFEKGKSDSSVAILFDKAVLKGGQQVPVHATIQAIAPPVQLETPMDSGAPSAPTSNPSASQSNGGLVGGAAQTAGSAVGSVADTAGSVAANTGAVAGSGGETGAIIPAGLSSNSQGVIGIRDVRLSAAGSATQGSVLTSVSSNVHLDGGTRMILRVSAE
jgi:hypothetical protein